MEDHAMPHSTDRSNCKSVITACPLSFDWEARLAECKTQWEFVGGPAEERLKEAHRVPRGRRLVEIDTRWEAAPDCPPQAIPEWEAKGYHYRIHTEFTFSSGDCSA